MRRFKQKLRGASGGRNFDHETYGFPHATRRARERYGIDFTFQTDYEIRQQIMSGNAEPVEDTRNDDKTQLFRLTAEWKPCLIVFNKRRNRVVTFLPLDQETYLPSPPHVEAALERARNGAKRFSHHEK